MKKLTPFLILGLVLRLVLMIFTVHPDIRGHNLAAYLIAQKREFLGFYDHLGRLPRTHPLVVLYHDGLFIYPPLAYLTHAVFNLFLYPLYPQKLFNLLILDMGQAEGLAGFGFLTFLLKFPYLVADFLGLLSFFFIFSLHDRSVRHIYRLIFAPGFSLSQTRPRLCWFGSWFQALPP